MTGGVAVADGGSAQNSAIVLCSAVRLSLVCSTTVASAYSAEAGSDENGGGAGGKHASGELKAIGLRFPKCGSVGSATLSGSLKPVGSQQPMQTGGTYPWNRICE